MLLSLPFFLLACSSTPELESPASPEVLDAQLEAFSVNHLGEEPGVASGALSIEGEGADFNITAPIAFTVHSPAGTDLAAWVGTDVDVIADVAGSEADWTATPGIEVSDVVGLVWLAEPGVAPVFADARFGDGFATHGKELGEELRGNYIVTFTSVVFQTDEGEVEATAGAPVTLTLEGSSYRATVLAAYTTEEAPGAPQYDCMGKPPLLSYELVRVEAAVEWEPMRRPATLEVADIGGCGE
ncbi:MAG: hypothetical protein EXR71_03700 [Myxococcales bacterium]|nr:hypothetical protein [Myxococcales bacterium]